MSAALSRPSARALLPSPDQRMLELLRAKAAMCDVYRIWLTAPTRKNRERVNQALLRIDELEAGPS